MGNIKTRAVTHRNNLFGIRLVNTRLETRLASLANNHVTAEPPFQADKKQNAN